jgi:hypothetical protein
MEATSMSGAGFTGTTAAQACYPKRGRIDPLEFDFNWVDQIPAASFCLSMISAQTLRVCREGKPDVHFSGSCSDKSPVVPHRPLKIWKP